MTTELTAGLEQRRPARPASFPVVPLTIVGLVVARLLFVARPATPDEGGFLLVASQWHVGGTSLYGDYWVDRPPLLVGIFRVADLLGGLTALRVIGALAAAATVALLASTARRAFGPRAAVATALVAAALLATPLYGAQVVDGELLAAPFVALGIRLAVEAVSSEDALSARAAALGTGAVAVLALMVKQNMADVVVFAAACWLVAWRVRRIPARTVADLVALAAVGAGVGYAVVMLWAMAHGTSPLGVYEATYPFRLKAGRIIADSTSAAANVRLSRLSTSFVLSAAPLVLAAFLTLALRPLRRSPFAWALVAAGGYATVSVLAGGSYWLHYLIQAIPVTALSAGALATVRPGRAWAWVPVSLVVASAVGTTAVSIASPSPAPGATVARAMQPSVQPGDTMLSAFGDADILHDTGMASPYPYLWSLPSRTLDPDMVLLRGILAGPDAPTWIVVRGTHTLGRLDEHGIGTRIRSRYAVVGAVCGRTIYLLRGLTRPPLDAGGDCGGTVLP